jgi:hypothetical protein
MTRPESYGNNLLGSAASFVEKKIYYEETFPENLIPNHISLWDNNRLYGRINLDGEVMALKERFLAPLKYTKGNRAMFAINFVADAFADLVTRLNTCVREQRIVPKGAYANIEVNKSWRSLNEEYDRHIKDQVFSLFVESYAIFENQNRKIRDFSGFLEVFGSFAKHLCTSLPVTRTGFVESTFCSPYTTGLVIEIAKEDYSDDYAKSSKYINDPNFLFFADLAKQYGFMIDRNAPWRLIANLGSVSMQEYAANRGFDLGDNIQENIAIIQDVVYKRTSQVDMNILAAYLKDMYNAYVERNPYIFEQIVKENHKCGSVQKVYEREQIGDVVIDESFTGGKYKHRWAIRSYYYLRMFERGVKNTLRKDKKNLRLLYDTYTAMSVRGPSLRGYAEAVRTVESEMLGPL